MTATVVAMLLRKNGAALPESMSRMGWQKHTVRGLMAGAMKAGYTGESFRPEGGERTLPPALSPAPVPAAAGLLLCGPIRRNIGTYRKAD